MCTVVYGSRTVEPALTSRLFSGWSCGLPRNSAATWNCAAGNRSEYRSSVSGARTARPAPSVSVQRGVTATLALTAPLTADFRLSSGPDVCVLKKSETVPADARNASARAVPPTRAAPR